jgi:spore coat protein A
MTSRRDLLKIGALAGASAVIPWRDVLAQTGTLPQKRKMPWRDPVSLSTQSVWSKHPIHHMGFQATSPTLARYVDPLPIPNVIKAAAGTTTQISMSAFQQKLHRDMPATPLWGYNGTFPGPTIEVRSGSPVKIKWTSQLPTKHFLPVDTSIHGAESTFPEVRSVVHLHGIKVMPDSDGYPEAWFTSDGKTGPSFKSHVYQYPNDQQACHLWYHDHSLGITRLNVYTGLAGMYIIRDEVEDSLNLPKGNYEIPLLIQDRMFNADGSLLYPTAEGGTHPYWIPEFFGDNVLVNGKVAPYLEVEPRKYRFRMLNGSNARFYHLTLTESDAAGNPNGNVGPAFTQIGTDGGLLGRPVRLNELLIAPAERFDIVIDFAGLDGKSFVILNDGAAPYPGGGEAVPLEVMQFRVTKKLVARDTSAVPARLNPQAIDINPKSAVRERNLVMTEQDRESDGFPIIALLDNKSWDDPVTENPKLNTTEIWSLVNATGDAHPKHIHLVQFQVLERRPFDVDVYAQTGNIVFTGPAIAPDPNERNAYKDVVKSYPGTVTKLIMPFELPKSAKIIPGKRYRYVWHCHVLEHEDNEMMRPYDVVA